MDIFTVLSLIGGLALFLYGMDLMGDGLKKLAGGKLESLLAKLTSARWKGLLLGLGVTAVIQSSSATTVMLVGFVNSGIMKLGQTISIIMGANVGTTVTSWLLSTADIQGTATLIKLFKPESFTPILAVIGLVMNMTAKDDKRKNTSTILIGFAILMFGMDMMSSAVEGLKDNQTFTNLKDSDGKVTVKYRSPKLTGKFNLTVNAKDFTSSAKKSLTGTGCSAAKVTLGENFPEGLFTIKGFKNYK